MFQFSITGFLQQLLYNPGAPLVFQSVLFIALFTFLYLVYVFVYKNPVQRNILLLIFSLFFYYKISGYYVGLLVLMASHDYLIGRRMFAVKRQGSRKGLLFLSLIVNLGLLVFFKYTNFLLDAVFGIATGTASPVVLDIIAPVGISYFVFKSLSYTLDIYRGEIEAPEKSYFNYLLYVSFFPNILSGPILRARNLLPQFRSALNFDRDIISKGFLLIIIGAFKKIFIADFLGVNLVDRVFDSPEYFSAFEYLMAGYAYLVQLYFDFSGYTDMVIGVAMLLGFRSDPNFNKPFSAGNVTDFWRRWHLTLSSWLRDYLFSPMSVKFRGMGNIGLALAVLITFLVCGIWHGPSLTFIIWGGLHGLAMAWDIFTNKARTRFKKRRKHFWYKLFSVIITFHFLMLTFIVFRAESLSTAWLMISGIFTRLDFSLTLPWMELYLRPFLIMLLGLALHSIPMQWEDKAGGVFARIHWFPKALLIALAIIIIYQSFSSEAQPFIYLEF